MGRTFVIPDIHGCNMTFRHLLFTLLVLEKSDTLYLLGDYIDRGADSKGVIDTILELIRGGYDVRPIRGNHEQMLLNAITTHSSADSNMWLLNGGNETLESYGVDNEDNIPENHLDFINSLPFLLVSESHAFVHGGLDFTTANPLTDTTTDFMLWNKSNGRIDPTKTGNRKLIAGHTVTHLDLIKEGLESNLIQLDNGCYRKREGFGNLLALELYSGRLFVQKNIDSDSQLQTFKNIPVLMRFKHTGNN